MTTIDLSDYNLGELKGLHFEIEQEIRKRRKDEAEQARARILAIAGDAGIPADALLGTPGAKPAPRYRNPADAAQTWSGRGRQPKWVADALAGGRTLEQMRIAGKG